MKKRILSGIKPTGQIHLGNLYGALNNWRRLQDEYDSFFMVADLHALTTVYEDTSNIHHDTDELKIDLLAVGLDPKRCTLFVQSDVPEHAELHLLLSMITPLPWLQRVPTYKGTMQELSGKDINTYGFLGYPMLQAADILIYQADCVPVGKDQIPHLELTREVARRFNSFFGNVFRIPNELLTEIPVLIGTDGRKMSKSYGNAIYVFEPEEQLRKKIKSMVTDPARLKKDDPGHPDICNVFAFHKIFNPAQIKTIETECKAGSRGCVACKQECADCLLAGLRTCREKKEELLKNKDQVNKIFSEGAAKAREVASQTLHLAKKHMKLIK
ncbi:MAG: tryptophan--tRNA ligase [Candidatus Margulisiibacteriota bacterium]|jgi:tryptophanyl-tRNA synthetase